jgi:hypothetical protein
MPEPFKFFIQDHDKKLDKNLCGFFALSHFTNGRITREQYIAAAAQVYIDACGVSKDDAEKLALEDSSLQMLEKCGLRFLLRSLTVAAREHNSPHPRPATSRQRGRRTLPLPTLSILPTPDCGGQRRIGVIWRGS